MKKVTRNILTIFGGGFVGLINGFLGAGGGMLVVPLLKNLNREDEKISHATAVFLILPISIVSVITFFVKGYSFSYALIPVMVGSVIGGTLGTFALCKLKNNIISIIFTLVMIAAGIFMIVKNI